MTPDAALSSTMYGMCLPWNQGPLLPQTCQCMPTEEEEDFPGTTRQDSDQENIPDNRYAEGPRQA